MRAHTFTYIYMCIRTYSWGSFFGGGSPFFAFVKHTSLVFEIRLYGCTGIRNNWPTIVVRPGPVFLQQCP